MSIKIGVVSDIHLEFGGYNRHFGTGDVLLVPGDLHVAAYMASKRPELLAVVERSQDFVNRALQSYDHVVSVMGNHEHYHGILNASQRIIRNTLTHPNFHILEKEAVSIKGVTFFGGTFWTDFNRNDPYSKLRAEQYMNDYHTIQVADEEDLMVLRRLRPDDLYTEHLVTLKELADVRTQAKELGQPLVVLSHHAPSKRSTHPRYAKDYAVNGAYSSDLEHLFNDDLPLWVHGHTHDNFDYTVNGTRVVCNPRGYVGHHLNPHFDPGLEIVL